MGIININIGKIIKGRTNSKHESIEGFVKNEERIFNEKNEQLGSLLDNAMFPQLSNDAYDKDFAEFDSWVKAAREENEGKSK